MFFILPILLDHVFCPTKNDVQDDTMEQDDRNIVSFPLFHEFVFLMEQDCSPKMILSVRCHLFLKDSMIQNSYHLSEYNIIFVAVCLVNR